MLVQYSAGACVDFSVQADTFAYSFQSSQRQAFVGRCAVLSAHPTFFTWIVTCNDVSLEIRHTDFSLFFGLFFRTEATLVAKTSFGSNIE